MRHRLTLRTPLGCFRGLRRNLEMINVRAQLGWATRISGSWCRYQRLSNHMFKNPQPDWNPTLWRNRALSLEWRCYSWFPSAFFCWRAERPEVSSAFGRNITKVSSGRRNDEARKTGASDLRQGSIEPIRLCSAIVAGHGRFFQLRNFLFDYFDPDGCGDPVRRGVKRGRPGDHGDRLAAGDFVRSIRRRRHGGIGLRHPHLGRALSLGSVSGRPNAGLVHRMVEPDWTNCGDRWN